MPRTKEKPRPTQEVPELKTMELARALKKSLIPACPGLTLFPRHLLSTAVRRTSSQPGIKPA